MANEIPAQETVTYKKVMAEILSHVNKKSILWTNKARWYVGITNDTDRRKREHEIKNKCLPVVLWPKAGPGMGKKKPSAFSALGFYYWLTPSAVVLSRVASLHCPILLDRDANI